MTYEVMVQLPPGLACAPLAVRLLREMAALPEGPGEEVDRLLPAFESLLAALLRSLEAAGAREPLALRLQADQVHLSLEFTGPAGLTDTLPGGDPTVAGDTPPPRRLPDAGTLLAPLRQVFDEVEMESAAGQPLRLRLVRHIPC